MAKIKEMRIKNRKLSTSYSQIVDNFCLYVALFYLIHFAMEKICYPSGEKLKKDNKKIKKRLTEAPLFNTIGVMFADYL